MRGVPLDGDRGTGVGHLVAGARLRLVHGEPDVGDHLGWRGVLHVDDPGRADGRAGLGGAAGEAVVGVLVELQQVVPAVAGERLGRLGDGVLRPGQRGEHGHLGVRPPVLDLAHVEDAQTAAGEGAPLVADVRDVEPATVVADAHPVVVHAGLPEDHLRLRGDGDVDGLEVVARRAGDVERAAVGGEAALVTEAAGGRAGEQPRVPAVGAHVVEVEDRDVGRRVAELGAQDAALGVEQQRLVRAEHRGGGQLGGLHGDGGVRHVEHDDATTGDGLHQGVLGEEQRRVVEGADVTGRVDVALDLEATGAGGCETWVVLQR